MPASFISSMGFDFSLSQLPSTIISVFKLHFVSSLIRYSDQNTTWLVAWVLASVFDIFLPGVLGFVHWCQICVCVCMITENLLQFLQNEMFIRVILLISKSYGQPTLMMKILSIIGATIQTCQSTSSKAVGNKSALHP